MSDPQRTASYLDEITLLRAEVAMWKGIHEGAVAATTADVDRLRAEVERLRAALGYALETGVGVQYWGDDDDCGTHKCCGEVSYKPHDPECWTVKARAALEKETST